MKIAYFINQYPKVSHSFIRREITALEMLGCSVKRFAVRSNRTELVDLQDVAEFEQTRYLSAAPLHMVAAALIFALFTRPINFCTVLWAALTMGLHSDRGALRHIFYFVEACLLKRWLSESEISHVHAHFGTNSAMVVMLCRRLGGPPYSFTVHGPEEFDKPEFISLGEKIRESSFTVAISSYGRSQLYRWVEHDYWSKIHVVHCGVETAFHHDAPLPRYNSNNFVCVGRLCEQKGQLLLIDVLARLVELSESIHITLAGDGPMRSRIERSIASYGLEKHVTITGWISSEQVRDEVLKARALILPSYAEGLPVVIMEAMALRCPVLSSYVAGIPELVIPQENGWLVPAGDCDKLLIAVREILHMGETDLQEYGMNARERVLERHSIMQEAEKLLNLFKASMEGKPGT